MVGASVSDPVEARVVSTGPGEPAAAGGPADVPAGLVPQGGRATRRFSQYPASKHALAEGPRRTGPSREKTGISRQLPWSSESGCGPCRESQAPKLGGVGSREGARERLGTGQGFLEMQGLALGLRSGPDSAGQGGGLGLRGTANAWR